MPIPENRRFVTEDDLANYPTSASLGFVAIAGEGIDYTGVEDSTDAIQALLDDLEGPTKLVLQAGVLKVSTLVFDQQVTLVGAGGAIRGDGALSPERATTTILSLEPTANCLVFNVAGSTLTDFAVVHDASVTPSAGAGIRLNKATNATLRGVTVLGFSTNLWTDGVYWNMSQCWLYDPVVYGLHVSNTASDYVDHGDFGITNNVISAMYREYEAVAGVEWESGGGIRFVGNKINAAAQPGNPSNRRWQYGMRFDARDDTATGDLTISGNSIANCSVALIRITQTGNGYFGYFSVTGNQINVGDDTCVGVHVGAEDDLHWQNIRDGIISDNVFHDFPGSSIVIDYAANVNVGLNTHKNVGSPVVMLGGGTQSAYPIGASVASQAVAGDDVTLLEDWRSHGVDSPREGTMAHDYQRAWHETTVNNDQTMFRVGVMQDGAIQATVRISGYNWAGDRQFVIEEQKFFRRNGGGAVDHTTLGTILKGGAAADDILITYDCPWEGEFNGHVFIKVRATNGTYPNIDAEVQLTMQGGVQAVHKGN